MEVPFKSAEEAFFWAVAVFQAKQNVKTLGPKFAKFERPCTYEDVLMLVGRLGLTKKDHAIVVKYGMAGEAPDSTKAKYEADLWEKTMKGLDGILRDKRIVVSPTDWAL